MDMGEGHVVEHCGVCMEVLRVGIMWRDMAQDEVGMAVEKCGAKLFSE